MLRARKMIGALGLTAQLVITGCMAKPTDYHFACGQEAMAAGRYGEATSHYVALARKVDWPTMDLKRKNRYHQILAGLGLSYDDATKELPRRRCGCNGQDTPFRT